MAKKEVTDFARRKDAEFLYNRLRARGYQPPPARTLRNLRFPRSIAKYCAQQDSSKEAELLAVIEDCLESLNVYQQYY